MMLRGYVQAQLVINRGALECIMGAPMQLQGMMNQPFMHWRKRTSILVTHEVWDFLQK